MIEEMAVRVCLVHFNVAQAEQLAFSVHSVMPHVYHAHAVKDCLGQVKEPHVHACNCPELSRVGATWNESK